MKYLIMIFVLVLSTTPVVAGVEIESFNVCPLCTKQGALVCPVGYEAFCEEEVKDETQPKCIFYGTKYIPGCWKLIGTRKIDFDFSTLGLPSSYMIKTIGGGETYTLDREIIRCKASKL